MFMYGNCNKNETQVKEKIFPFLLEKAADILTLLIVPLLYKRVKSLQLELSDGKN